jgi:hypothetical protein
VDVEGAPIALEEFERYELGCGGMTGDRASDVRGWIATPSATRVEDFTAGDYYCALRVRRLLNGQLSAFSGWSNEINFLMAPAAPEPPANLAVD